MPRPNHGVTLMQLMEIISNGAAVANSEFGKLTHTEQDDMKRAYDRFSKNIAKMHGLAVQ